MSAGGAAFRKAGGPQPPRLAFGIGRAGWVGWGNRPYPPPRCAVPGCRARRHRCRRHLSLDGGSGPRRRSRIPRPPAGQSGETEAGRAAARATRAGRMTRSTRSVGSSGPDSARSAGSGAAERAGRRGDRTGGRTAAGGGPVEPPPLLDPGAGLCAAAGRRSGRWGWGQLLPGYPEAEQQRAESVGQGRAHLRWGSGCAGCGRAGAFGAGAAGLGAALCPLCLLWVVCLFVFSPLLPLTGSLRAGARLAGAALPSSRDAPPAASRRPSALRARRGPRAPRPAHRRPAALGLPPQPPIAARPGGPGGPSAAAPQGAPRLRGRGGRGQGARGGWPGKRRGGSLGARRHMGSRGPPRRPPPVSPGRAGRVAAGAPR